MFPRIVSVALFLVFFVPVTVTTVFAAVDYSPQSSRSNGSNSIEETARSTKDRAAGSLPSHDIWPSLRLVDKEDGLITDLVTGLIWTKTDNAPGTWECRPGTLKNWWESGKYVKCLNDANYLGHRDWRLPSVTEMESLLSVSAEYKHPWPGEASLARIREHHYWTTIELALVEYNGVWMLYKLTYPPYTYNLTYYYYVWPVCSKASARPVTEE